MRLFTFYICFMISASDLLAQGILFSQSFGARSHGLGSVRLNLQDSWTYFNNIGALARVDASGIALGYDARFGLKELQTLSLAANFNHSVGNFALGLSRFGGDLYSEQSVGIGFSNQLGIVSFGVKVDWFQTRIENFGTGNAFPISIGGVAELGPKLSLAAHIININRAKASRQIEEHLPTAVQLGISYFPETHLRLFMELEKNLEIDPALRVGIEYEIRELIVLRSGVKSNPGDLFFGLGLIPGDFRFDYAFGQNTILGNTHHVSLAWLWND
ncbi:PorV/PorQ family protein [Algoriphagus namhaensis]